MMTPEREKYLREFYVDSENPNRDGEELFEEIDSLRRLLKNILKRLDEEEYPQTIIQIKKALKNDA